MQADSEPLPRALGLMSFTEMSASKSDGKFRRAEPAKVALATESESEMRRAGDVPFV